MIFYLFNFCVKIVSAPALKDSWHSMLLDSNPSSFFVKRTDFQAVSVDQACLSLWASQEETILQKWGWQPYVPNTTLRIRDSTFIVTIPFRDDAALRRQIFALTPPLSGLVFANTQIKSLSIDLSTVFNSDTCWTWVPPPKLNFLKLILLVYQPGLVPTTAQLKSMR